MSNYNVLEVPNGVPIFLWNNGVKIEDAAIQQLINLAKTPYVYHHIAAMPDTHFGIGATVGSVAALEGAVAPAIIGVDIGCGMLAARTNLRRDFLDTTATMADPASFHYLKLIRSEIERLVPMGRTNNGRQGDRGAWHDVPDFVQLAWESELKLEFDNIVHNHPVIGQGNTVNHLGTLGTGNHFIEIQFDEQDRIWIMLHSGSRGVGNRIGQYFIKKAKELMERFFVQLPDKDLAFIPNGEKLYGDYIQALHWAQDFARINRNLMFGRTYEALNNVIIENFNTEVKIEEIINTHHNYASMEKHFGKNVLLTRKGAIRAGEGDLGIIPGSMGTRSYIVRGKGSPFSFCSSSHGAGRAMSRTQAMKQFTLEDHAKAMIGVEGRLDKEVIDETPAAYKQIESVLEAEKDLVEPVTTLKQIIVCKG